MYIWCTHADADYEEGSTFVTSRVDTASLTRALAHRERHLLNAA
jgi:hypothetical protein